MMLTRAKPSAYKFCSTEIIQIQYEDVFSNTFVSSTFYNDHKIETLRRIYFELINSYCPFKCCVEVKRVFRYS